MGRRNRAATSPTCVFSALLLNRASTCCIAGVRGLSSSWWYSEHKVFFLASFRKLCLIVVAACLLAYFLYLLMYFTYFIYLLTYLLLTYSLRGRFAYENNSLSFVEPEVSLRCVHNTPQFDLIFNHSAHILMSHIFKILLNISLSSASRSSQWILPLSFRIINICISHLLPTP